MCRVRPVGHARYTRHLGMLVENGFFRVEDAERLFAAMAREDDEDGLCIEMVLTPAPDPSAEDGVILELRDAEGANLVFLQSGSTLYLEGPARSALTDRRHPKRIRLVDPPNPDRPLHLIVPMIVRARLDAITPLKAAEGLTVDETYPRVLALARYTVERIVAGEYKEKELAVLHWAMLDAEEVPAYASKRPGEVDELTLERLSAQPQVEAERRIETVEVDLDLPLFLDVGETGPPAGESETGADPAGRPSPPPPAHRSET